MMFITFIRVVAVMIQIILTLIIFVVITAFALQPTEIIIFTNALILVMIMVQLYTVSTLTELYEQLEKIKVVKKR